MDIYSAAFIAAITPQILVAIIGSFVGVNISSDLKLYGIRLTVMTAIITVAIAALASEYLTIKWQTSSIFAHFVLGGLVGMTGMRALDAIRLALPSLMNSMIDVAGKSTLDLISALFKKLRTFFGL